MDFLEILYKIDQIRTVKFFSLTVFDDLEDRSDENLIPWRLTLYFRFSGISLTKLEQIDKLILDFMTTSDKFISKTTAEIYTYSLHNQQYLAIRWDLEEEEVISE